MADNDTEVPDSTDWLSTPLAALAAVESSLRCQVCKDFYNAAMLTSCSHTFCSLCIRRALSSDSKCPLCRAPEQAIKLRGNWSMDEAVEAFKAARPAMLDVARSAGNGGSRSPKRKAEDINGGEESSRGGSKRLRSSARLSQRESQQPPSYTIDIPDDEEAFEIPETPDPEEDDDFAPPPDDGLYPCPSCQKRMKEWQIFVHLDSCPGPSPKKSAPEKRLTLGHGPSRPREHNKTLERLPALNYSMLKDNALRKRLADLGISSQGTRSLLERRHKEYVTMWNANCDAARPKSHHELLRQLDGWERTQGGKAPVGGRAAQNAAIIKDKDFDGSAWASQHNNSFKDLIASARKSSLQAKQKPKEGDTAVVTTQEAQASTPSVGPEAGAAPAATNSHDTSICPEEAPGDPTSAVTFREQDPPQAGSTTEDPRLYKMAKYSPPQGVIYPHVTDATASSETHEQQPRAS